MPRFAPASRDRASLKGVTVQPGAYEYKLAFVAALLIAACLVPVVALVAARFLAPRKPSPLKQETYECGMAAKGDAWVQFNVQYYLYALVFVIFDVETIFLYPWAVAFKRLGLFALVEMIIFLAILAAGWLYAWKKGLLEWQ